VTIVNMLEAKTSLSKLVLALEEGTVSEIIIARNGKPAAKLVPISMKSAGRRIGVAKGKFVVPENIDRSNKEIEKLFGRN
jgi:prevent-host-death family protein